ncbi:GAF and ANTAR domain-containing protein [Modestobacter marinus]|uniref:GAF and ANTAR domain-containing protein n=1 Tax=Modestobacter marinus TaxID=477641 RepID=UPI00227D02DD|nr:GAF and ANTAR domain-containing protein [Modestobacter marinus]
MSRRDQPAWLPSLVSSCADSLGAVGVGLALADASGLIGVAAATAGAGQAGEDLQFALGEGPCRLASASRRPVAAPELAGDERWVEFAPQASGVGIAAAFSVPLQVGAVLLGVLDVYRAVPGPLSQALLPVLEVYAQAATAVLLMLTDSGGRPAGAAELAELADIRPVVHQATGMIAVQLDVDLTTALLRLRAHAFHAGRPMQHLAVDVVARRLTLDHSTTGAQHHRAPAPDAPVPDPSDFKQRNRDEHP